MEFVLAATLSEYLQVQWAARAKHAVAVVETELQRRAYLELPEKRKLVWEPGPGGPRGCCELLEFRVDRMLKIVARRQLTGVLREATLVMPSSPIVDQQGRPRMVPGPGRTLRPTLDPLRFSGRVGAPRCRRSRPAPRITPGRGRWPGRRG